MKSKEEKPPFLISGRLYFSSSLSASSGHWKNKGRNFDEKRNKRDARYIGKLRWEDNLCTAHIEQNIKRNSSERQRCDDEEKKKEINFQFKRKTKSWKHFTYISRLLLSLVCDCVTSVLSLKTRNLPYWAIIIRWNRRSFPSTPTPSSSPLFNIFKKKRIWTKWHFFFYIVWMWEKIAYKLPALGGAHTLNVNESHGVQEEAKNKIK